jgi:hypothetical protein
VIVERFWNSCPVFCPHNAVLNNNALKITQLIFFFIPTFSSEMNCRDHPRLAAAACASRAVVP